MIPTFYLHTFPTMIKIEVKGSETPVIQRSSCRNQCSISALVLYDRWSARCEGDDFSKAVTPLSRTCRKRHRSNPTRVESHIGTYLWHIRCVQIVSVHIYIIPAPRHTCPYTTAYLFVYIISRHICMHIFQTNMRCHVDTVCCTDDLLVSRN